MVVTSKGIASAAVVLSAALFIFTASAAESTVPGVLIIHSNQRPTPAQVIIDDTLRAVVSQEFKRPVSLFSEYLDAEWGSPKTYGLAQAQFLREKYDPRNISVIVANALPALRFAMQFRDRTFPGVPVVYLGVAADRAYGMALPSDFVGVLEDLDPTPTLQLALRLHPDVRRLVLVRGAGEFDPGWDTRMRRAVEHLEGGLQIDYLSALSTAEVLRRVGMLPPRTIVFTPGYFVDGAGEVNTPRASAERIAQASAVPVYGVFETQLGTGIIGGYMSPYEDEAKQAGTIVVSLMNGAAPSEIPTTVAKRFPIVDWRQIRRWGVDERLLAGDAVVRFREPTTWEKHRAEIAVAIAVLLLQAGTIVWLLMERRRRRLAEADSQKRFSEMAHMNRRVAMGGLAASIAHELNQPLGAIHNNAGAAQILIKANPPKLAEVAEILEDIQQDDKRASEVISRIRKMLRKTDVEAGALDLNEAVGETLKLLAFDASAHDMSVKTELEPGLAKVWADGVQVQQVLLNLALNAMEAMHDQRKESRQLTIRSRQANAKEAEVSVVDSGVGIPADMLPRIFDPFVTSKPGGMGLGLSISRTIVEAYGGRMSAENLPSGGAVFHFTLPFESERGARDT
jgi:signal transduction histidine kinase